MADPQNIPPPPDGSAIVAQSGAMPPPPPDGSAIIAQGGIVASSNHDATASDTPPGFWDTLEREGKSVAGNIAGIPSAVYHAFAEPPTQEETDKFGGPAEVSGAKRIGLGVHRLVTAPVENAVGWYSDAARGKIPNAYEQFLSAAPEGMGAGAAAAVLPKLTGAATEGIGKVAPIVKNVVTDAFAKDLPAQESAAHANFMKAIPPTKSAPYELGDLQKARPFLEDAHADSPIKTPQDVVDAANAGLSRIENHVSQAIQNHPGAQLTVDPVQAAKSAVAQSDLGIAKPEAVEAAGKELEPYNFDEPKTLAEADRIRRQLNSENRSFENRNNTVQFDARNTDPGYAARDAANDAIKGNLYDRLADLGEDGIGDLRQTEGSLVRIRNAAQNQIFNGDKAVGGTGNNSSIANAGRNLVRAGSTGVGVLAGEHLGGPWGATAGGITGAAAGEFINKWAFPGNLTRAELLDKAFAKPVTEGATLPDISAKPRVAGLLNAAPTELPPSTLTNPPSEPPAVDATTRAVRKGLLLNEPAPQLPNPGYTEPQGEPIGTAIGDKAQPYKQPQGWPANAKSQTTQAPNPSSASVPAKPANGRPNAGPAVYEPRQPELPVASGTRTDIKVPGSDQSYPAQYEVRELSDVHPFDMNDAPAGKMANPIPRATDAIATDRELSALGKATESDNFTEVNIPVKELRTRQPYLDQGGGKSKGIPEAYKTDGGETVLLDGNHRVADAIKRGAQSVKVKMWNTEAGAK